MTCFPIVCMMPDLLASRPVVHSIRGGTTRMLPSLYLSPVEVPKGVQLQARAVWGRKCVCFPLKIVCQTVRDIRTGDTRKGTKKKRSNVHPHGHWSFVRTLLIPLPQTHECSGYPRAPPLSGGLSSQIHQHLFDARPGMPAHCGWGYDCLLLVKFLISVLNLRFGAIGPFGRQCAEHYSHGDTFLVLFLFFRATQRSWLWCP